MKQSGVSLLRPWIASLALAMTVTAMTLFENRIQMCAGPAARVHPACPTAAAVCGSAFGTPRPASRSACIIASVSTAIAVA